MEYRSLAYSGMQPNFTGRESSSSGNQESGFSNFDCEEELCRAGETDRALEYCDRALALAIELGIPLAKECEELKAQLENER